MLESYVMLTNTEGGRVILRCECIQAIEELAACFLPGGEVCPHRTRVACAGELYIVQETAEEITGKMARQLEKEAAST